MKRDAYTVECLNLEQILSGSLREFLAEVGQHLSDAYENKFDWRNFRIRRYMRVGGRITICYRNGKPVGLMAARLSESIFDPEVRIFFQDTLYAKSGTRAAKLLLDDFIDFGRSHANHVLTTIGTRTNIRPGSLEKLGFKKLEETYRMEI